MVLIFCYLNVMKSTTSMPLTLGNAEIAYSEGNLEKANAIFRDTKGLFIQNGVYQEKYFKYLMETGQYEEILRNEATCAAPNRRFMASARRALAIVLSKDLQNISGLVKESPSFYEAVLAKARIAFRDSDDTTFMVNVNRARKLRPEAEEPMLLLGRYRLLRGEYVAGLELLREAKQTELADSFSELLGSYTETRGETMTAQARFKSYERIQLNLMAKQFSDSFRPSVYKHLSDSVLHELVTIGINNGIAGVLKYASKYLKSVDTPESIFLYIKAHIVEKRPIREVQQLIAQFRERLNENHLKALSTHLQLLEQNERQRREEEQQRRQQQYYQQQQRQQQYYQQQRQQQQRQQAPSAASRRGTDFLGYYAALGTTNTATQAQIRKAFKKASLKAHRIKDKKEQEEALMKINSAHKFLGDESTKQMYDQGINPSNPNEGQDMHGGQYYKSAGDFEDIFSAFFGSQRGGPFSGGGRRQQRFVYFN